MGCDVWLITAAALAVSTGVTQAQPVPAIELHHYDHQSVQLLNKGQAASLTITTNLLVLQQIAPGLKVREVPIARTDKMMLDGAPVCAIDRVKTNQRQQHFLFSKPVNFYLGYRLYQRADASPLPQLALNKQGQVLSLAGALAAVPGSRLLVSSRFAFADPLDGQIAKLDASQQEVIYDGHYVQQFIGMLLAGRADFALIYPSALYENFQDRPPVALRSYAIVGVPPLISGQFMCADTPHTRAWLATVDQALTALYQQPAFFAAHRRFLPAQQALELKTALQHAGYLPR